MYFFIYIYIYIYILIYIIHARNTCMHTFELFVLKGNDIFVYILNVCVVCVHI